MATLTIRNLPEDVVDRLKASAQRKGLSMEQEVREILLKRYAARATVLDRVRNRWEKLPATSAEEVQTWRATKE